MDPRIFFFFKLVFIKQIIKYCKFVVKCSNKLNQYFMKNKPLKLVTSLKYGKLILWLNRNWKDAVKHKYEAEIWEKRRFVPIPMKEDFNLAKQYRGISLSASKICNKMLLSKTCPHIDSLLRINQSVFGLPCQNTSWYATGRHTNSFTVVLDYAMRIATRKPEETGLVIKPRQSRQHPSGIHLQIPSKRHNYFYRDSKKLENW